MYGVVPYTALFLYPFVVVLFFNRMAMAPALVWSILAGYLFLPELVSFDLPLLPPINKDTVPAMTAGLVLMLRGREAMRRAAREAATALADNGARLRRSSQAVVTRHRHPLVVVLLLFTLLVPLAIAFANSDPVRAGPRSIAGLTLKDGASMMMAAMVTLLPFVLARRHLGTAEGQRAILLGFMGGAIIYTVLMLIEIRFSPQLHRLIYGYHQHSFIQHVRAGFRPMVFLAHGLEVGLFMCMSTLAAAALWLQSRNDRQSAGRVGGPGSGREAAAIAAEAVPLARGGRRQRPAAKGGLPAPGRIAMLIVWFLLMLVLSRNLGSTLIAIVLLPVMLLLGLRAQVLVATLIAGIVLVYPLLRGADLVPVDKAIELAATYDQQRADSLAFRVRHEDELLAKARKRPILGWGTWGRNRIHDDDTGQDISVTDGIWITTIGSYGWTGYLARFGLLTLPIFLIWRRRQRVDAAAAGLCIFLVANLIDLIPNSGLTPVSWMIAGALTGWAERNAPVRAMRGAAGSVRSGRGAAAIEAGG